MSTTLGAVETASSESASQAVVAAVAAETGSDPMTLEPLYGVLDPDALDALVAGDGPTTTAPPVRVEFTYAGCAVSVTGSGAVDVTELDR
ncbi:hypothetical protein SAMN05216559_3885 [Halomicrobium zhouii]|uniref:Halobacterial output domain-containing protein n=1 Tax=Halomicrobium zhouii TaxID=767519 RepID=A0A1I6M7N4_9EURY|nr:HalOD1 output domain-containing protein [Halomicrobium zhouii]SFS11522.1 hypothetical protein SAMN05216559_3885 [Halomicrobium zhouii]